MSILQKPLVELFVKASQIDKNEKGPCLIGQQWFMTMYCLVEQGLIDLRFTPVSLELPPPNYSRLNAARHLPIAWIESGVVNDEDLSGVVMESSEDLEGLMMKLGSPNLNPKIPQSEVWRAESVFRNLYVSFLNFIRVDKWNPLLLGLTKLDEFLAQEAHHFLIDDYITYADCQLMPKLQHIRVVLRAYKNMDIPDNLIYLYSYIRRMYETKAFTCACPLDRDILMHYSEKEPLPKSIRLSLLGPDRLLDVPGYRNHNAGVNGS